MGSHSTFHRAAIELNCDITDPPPNSITTLPELMLFNARYNPEKTFCVQAKQLREPGKGFEYIEISFLELALSVEQCCAWILNNIDGVHAARANANGSVEKAKPVALLLESSLTLFIYITALLTLNIPCLLLSIRLNSEAARYLLNQVGGDSVVTSPRIRSYFRDILDEACASKAAIHTTTAMGFEHFIPKHGEQSSAFPHLQGCRKTVREYDRDAIILHSSGTTGLPKPISLSHRYVLGYAGCHEFPIARDMSHRGYNLSTLPLFHGFGVLAPCLALSVGMPTLFPPSDTIPSGSLMISLIKCAQGRITSAMTVPTLVEEISLLPNFECDIAPQLATLDFLAVGGGGIKAAVGSKLHRNGVTLLNHFGATELGALAPVFHPDKDYDWQYLRLRQDLNLKLEIVEPKEDQAHICKLIGYPFAWNTPFELQDRLEANPLKPDLEVKILGRNDDLIVLATGEKVLPYILEKSLESHSLVKRAVVFGNGRFEIGVLLEPFSNDVSSREAFIDSVWPQLLEANKSMDSHARILSKSAILVKLDSKDIPLTDKGSVRRKEVYALYEADIDAVYLQLLLSNNDGLAAPFDLENPKNIVKELVQSCIPAHIARDTLNEDTDFVSLGMDSLQITRFRRLLCASLRNSGRADDLPVDIIYFNPSVLALTAALIEWLDGSISKIDPTKEMARFRDKYAYQIGRLVPQNLKVVVLVTGTTGNLGANLLHMLSQNHLVHRVICMIRPFPEQGAKFTQKELANRQQKALASQGIVLSEAAWLKVEISPWTPGARHLGLSEPDYQALASRVTHVFHAAWPMDFKMKLQSLEPHIKTVRDIIDFGGLAHDLRPFFKPRIILASSIAVVGRYAPDQTSAFVPENPIDDPLVPLPMGYAEAKWVCEKIMESAFHEGSNVEPIILRIGQLSGSHATGFWSPKEHFPALVRASQAINAMPNLQGTLSWIPVDRAARVSMDILLGPGPRELVYHLENPVRQSWQDMCTVIERSLSLEPSNRLAFNDWLKMFAGSKGASQELMEFFHDHFLQMSGGNLVLDTKNARTASAALRSTGGIDHGTVRNYLDSWKRVGFLE